MCKIWAGFVAVLSTVYWSGYAAAEEREGFDEIYNEETNVNLGGRWVVAEIALYADMDSAERGELSVALVTDVTKFVEQTELDLKNWLAARQNECGERWRAGTPQISFPKDAIRFSLDLEIEVWNCGLRGRGEPGMIANAAGRIDVVLNPYVEAGRLQAALGDFSVDEREGVTKYLPLEFVARRFINFELRKLNENPKFYRAPNPFYAEGFEYRALTGRRTEDERVVITADYRAEGSADVYDRLADAIREDGVTQ